MRSKWIQTIFILIGAVAVSATAAHAQTDVALSAYRTFTSTTSGNGTAQTPSNAIGGMLEVRHISKPLIGYELTYSYNRANQAYAPKIGSCGFVCANAPISLTASGNQVALDWVISHKYGSLRPFAVTGLGLFIDAPSANIYYANMVVRPTYVYGGGVDWGFMPHFGLRIQYRGNLYKAPDLSTNYNSTGAFTQSGEPMFGLYFHL